MQPNPSKSCCSIHSILLVSSVLYSNRLTDRRDWSALHEGASRVNYKITLYILSFLFWSWFGSKENKCNMKKKSISIIIYNTRLSQKSLQQLWISLRYVILLQKLTVKIEVIEVTVQISWELVNPVNLFSNYCSNSMRGVVSVYYGNVIAEAGLGLQPLFVRRYCARCVWHSAPLLPLKWVLSHSL